MLNAVSTTGHHPGKNSLSTASTPHPGAEKSEMGRGQREAVLGDGMGVDDAYARMPMSSLQAALRTKRPHDGGLDEPCSNKRRTDWEADVGSREYLRAPRLCIHARNGTEETQAVHRSGCKNEQCIAALRDHNLLTKHGAARGKRKASPGTAPMPPSKEEANVKHTPARGR